MAGCRSLASLEKAKTYLRSELGLSIKPRAKPYRADKAWLYCGYEIRRGIVLPGPRKRQRFVQQLKILAAAHHEVTLSETQLQRQLTALMATLTGCDAGQWRAHMVQKHWQECD